MAILTYGTEFRCDSCGETARLEAEPGKAERPPNWSGTKYSGQITRVDGRPFSDLCPACSSLPARVIIQMLEMTK